MFFHQYHLTEPPSEPAVGVAAVSEWKPKCPWSEEIQTCSKPCDRCHSSAVAVLRTHRNVIVRHATRDTAAAMLKSQRPARFIAGLYQRPVFHQTRRGVGGSHGNCAVRPAGAAWAGWQASALLKLFHSHNSGTWCLAMLWSEVTSVRLSWIAWAMSRRSNGSR